MENGKNIHIDKGLSMRSEEVNEIMGDIPHRITLWGMVLMTLILFIFGIGAYTFTVPEYLEVPYFIKGTLPHIAQISPADGILITIAKEKEHCHKHHPIATLETQDRHLSVTASADGHFYQNLIYPIGTYVSAGDTLGWIKWSHKVKQSVLLQIPTTKRNNIRKGQTVHIMLIDNQTFIIGRIHRIAEFPIGTTTIAEVILNDTTSQTKYLDYARQGRAKIIISKQRLIDKLSFR